jgi:hypothetical protein
MYQDELAYSGMIYFAKGGRGPSSHPGPGGNWPSTTPNPSGGGRGNARPGK